MEKIRQGEGGGDGGGGGASLRPIACSRLARENQTCDFLKRSSFTREAPWERKFGYLCIPEILVQRKSPVRTSVSPLIHLRGYEMSHLLAGSPRHAYTVSVFNLVLDIYAMDL